MLLLQEVEDWHLELCEREPGLAEKVTEVIEALVAGRRMDHIKGSTLHNLRNSDRRGAPPTSGSCSSSSETPSGASGGRRQGRELEGPGTTRRSRSPSTATGQWIKKQEGE